MYIIGVHTPSFPRLTPRTKQLKTISSPSPLSLAHSPSLVLEEGMSVFVSKEMGAVRYIGSTEFAEGIWLGVELRKPCKNS